MSTHNIPFSVQKENQPELSQMCIYGIFSRRLKNKFETAVVNEPSVFEPLKVCSISFNSRPPFWKGLAPREAN